MRTVLAGFIAVGLAGCGYSDKAFINDMTKLDCEYSLDCFEDATLNFLGWDKVSACEDERGPEIASLGVGCEFDKKAAKECAKQLGDLECAVDGNYQWPTICASVYSRCEDTDEPVDTGDTGAA